MQREAAGNPQVRHFRRHAQMPATITPELMHQIAEACVIHHQHPARPGIGAGVERHHRIQTVVADQHLLAFAQDLVLRIGLRMRRAAVTAPALSVVPSMIEASSSWPP